MRRARHLPFPIPDFSGEIAERFPGGVPPLNTVALIANFRAFLGCDLSDYKPLGHRAVGMGAEASAESFTIPRGTGNAVLSIEGAGGAPRVRLRSPSGKVYDFTGAANSVRVGNAVGQIVEREDRTVVILGGAEAGNWTAEMADGSAKVARVQLRTGSSPGSVRARSSKPSKVRSAQTMATLQPARCGPA